MTAESELSQIKNLLQLNKLPFEDISTSKVDFFSLQSDGKIIGCIGIEKYGHDGLLRSFAVENNFKNKGIGSQLLDGFLQKSKKEGIEKLHLLTTTADKYFAKKGFTVSDRKNAPEAIAGSKEFSEICPSNSIYMTKVIDL